MNDGTGSIASTGGDQQKLRAVLAAKALHLSVETMGLYCPATFAEKEEHWGRIGTVLEFARSYEKLAGTSRGSTATNASTGTTTKRGKHMYSDDDLFTIDEFFSVDIIASFFRYLISPQDLIDSVAELKRVSGNSDSDPVDVMKSIKRLGDVIGPRFLKHTMASDVWDDWCKTHTDYYTPSSEFDLGLCCWAGKRGSVHARHVDDKPDTPLVMHAVPASGGAA